MAAHIVGRRSVARRDSGFTVVQIVIALVVAVIITTFAILGIARYKKSMDVANAARDLAAWFELARTDSVRRHADMSVAPIPLPSPLPNPLPGNWPGSVIVNDSGSYDVTMDFAHFGVPTTRTITLKD